MTRLGGHDGFTVVELMVSIAIALVVFASALTLLTVVLKDSRSNQLRNEAQDSARTVVDRLSRELRAAVAPGAGSALLEQDTAYDIVFRQSTRTSPYQMRVRYCLDASNTLWKQTQTMQSTTDALPDTTTCPSSAWSTQSIALGGCAAPPSSCARVTNRVGGDARPLFTYGPAGWATPSQIKLVELDLYVDENQNADTEPPATHVTSGIYLRNDLAPPTAAFTVVPTTVTKTTRSLQLNASSSIDPNGQVLSYAWYTGGTCASPSGPLASGATSQEPPPQGPFTVGTNQTYLLVVTDTAGLSNCQSQMVTVQ